MTWRLGQDSGIVHSFIITFSPVFVRVANDFEIQKTWGHCKAALLLQYLTNMPRLIKGKQGDSGKYNILKTSDGTNTCFVSFWQSKEQL